MKNNEVIEHIVNWLKTYATQNNMNGFVVGVSGGIDSALTSTLCARTGLPTLCLEMPIKQQKNQVDRAQEHIMWLKKNHPNVSGKTINLDAVFSSFSSVTSGEDNSKEALLSLANSRSRLRMTTLYYFAARERYLVAGTGNKVEDFGVGFYTKYGDGGVDISPIADLMKSEVGALAKTLGISKAILEAPPTDGLWDDDRNDEQQLGATYKQLEWAMEQHHTGKKATDFVGENARVMTVFSQHHKANTHKMNPIPVCEIPDQLK
ncbi:MAG: NAD(+) synthase [Flavobacteriaceae bacterium]|nr:NAD(+) synthase [Flavobacteriaceae bacterium]